MNNVTINRLLFPTIHEDTKSKVHVNIWWQEVRRGKPGICPGICSAGRSNTHVRLLFLEYYQSLNINPVVALPYSVRVGELGWNPVVEEFRPSHSTQWSTSDSTQRFCWWWVPAEFLFCLSIRICLQILKVLKIFTTPLKFIACCERITTKM